MAKPSNPHNVEGEKPEQPVVAADEDEDDDVDAPGGGLPVLKWSKGGFQTLMTTVKMADDWKATYPQEGDTGADAPAGYITMWADFFTEGNLRLPVTVFVAEVLEYYHLHISQLSPFGMFRIRNFEYTFRAHGLPITVENFRRFYQLTVNTGFFSFNQRHGSLKLMTPPKGVTGWKKKFFYVKACAPAVGLWRMFEPDFKGKVELIPVELREGFNLEIVGNFRVPKRDVLQAPVPEGEKAILADLGKFEKRILKKHVEKKQVKKTMRGRGKKKAEGSVAPPSVSQAVGTYRSCYRRYTDYVVVSDTLEGLGVLGSAAASGTAAPPPPPPPPPVVGKKREPEQKAAGGGELKRRKLQSKGLLRRKRNLRLLLVKPEDAGYSLFDAPFSHSHTTAAGAGVPKEPSAPSVKVVPDPPVEETVEKTATQIFDTVDSSNNLISPTDGDGLDLRFSDAGKQKTDAEPQKSSAGEKVTGSSSGGAGYDGPPIQPGESELEYYYRTYTQDRSTVYHRPPWTIMQGVIFPMILPRAGRFWVVWAPHLKLNVPVLHPVLGRREEEAARLRAEAEELVKAARAGAEQLKRDRAAFDKQKQTAEWAATAELKQVRTLAKLLSDERKSWDEKFSHERKKWNESWAKQNDNLFRARQELTNVKAANVALGKEKAAAEVIAVKAQQAEARAVKALEEAKEAGARAAKAIEEAKERESRSSKALEEVNAERTRLDQVVAHLQVEVQTWEVAVTDLTARMTAAVERANAAVEARDALTSSFNQLEADREWMRSHGDIR
ncbi:hypothetical protein HanPI659440_Chr05g0209291 [Helianthus annuus]|nr:hypothetical protein HanPI659440_Chr05g0209291 [Helianthus annuus]